MPQCTAVAILSKGQLQARSLLFILLLVGDRLHTIQAVSDTANLLDADDEYNENRMYSPHHAAQAPVNRYAQDTIGDASPRELSVATIQGWAWPTQTALELHSTSHPTQTPTTTHVHSSTTEVTVLAGLPYKQIAIKSPSTVFGTDHNAPKIKLVTTLAIRTSCHLTTYDVPMGTVTTWSTGTNPVATRVGQSVMGMTDGPLSLTNAGGTSLSATTTSGSAPLGTLTFMFGGLYQICYTPDGTFTGDTYRNNILGVMVKVLGVTSPCTAGKADRCMDTERWECYFTMKGETPSQCIFDFRSDGGRSGWQVHEGGMKSTMSWTGTYQSSAPVCGSSPPETSRLEVSTTGTYLDIGATSVHVKMPLVKATTTDVFTVAACYCPNYDAYTGTTCGNMTAGVHPSTCCDNHQDFFQPIGLVYFWMIRICDYSNYNGGCATAPYHRVIPQQKFVARLDCPPGGSCSATNDNRIMYLEPLPNNDRPTWDALHGCKIYTQESGDAVWPTSSTDSKNVPGGTLTTYKAWHTKQVKLSLSLNKKLDVCYCPAACGTAMNWFRVGTVYTSNNIALAYQTSASSTRYSVSVVNKPGSITLYGGITGSATNPYDSNKYSGTALMNMFAYDGDLTHGDPNNKQSFEEYKGYHRFMPANFQSLMDLECSRENFRPNLVVGGWSRSKSVSYRAQVASNLDTVSNYLSFDGPNQDKDLTMARTGVIAICYCAMLNSINECAAVRHWVYAGRMTIRGPKGGQHWIFATHVVGKLELQGWGFDVQDRLRIIPASGTCDANSNFPNGDTTFKIGCPSTQPPPLGQSGCRFADATTTLILQVLTSTSSESYLTAVSPEPTKTTLMFDRSIEDVLGNNDIITIDENYIRNNNKALVSQNQTEKFDTYKLAARSPFLDVGTQYYTVGHRLWEVKNSATNIVDYNKLTIPIGWPLNYGTSLTFLNGRGHWTRHNKAETSLEIKGVQATTGLKACWGYQQGLTKFYAEAGTIDFVEPPAMPFARLSFTTRAVGAKAPVVLRFTTSLSSNDYRLAFDAVTSIVVRFLDVHQSTGKLIPLWADDLIPDISTQPAEPDWQLEVLEQNKRQWVCGRMFSELWSDDNEGFPMPLGCYFTKKYKDNVQNNIAQTFIREVHMVFPPSGGLKHNTTYAMVMNAKQGVINLNENVVDVYSMCIGPIGCARPFQVFEKATITAETTTQGAATFADPSFNTQGFTLQLGNPTDKVLDLRANNVLQAKLRGQDNTGAIRQGCILRVSLWPILMWSVGPSCAATCHSSNSPDTCSGTASCATEEAAAGSNHKNIIKITLPVGMTDITSTNSHTVKVQNLALPVDGFFATRVGAQITRPDDSRPSYTTSHGFLLALPGTDTSSGRLIIYGRTNYGDRPFVGDVGNTMYMRLTFGITLWNNGYVNNASSFVVTLPPGYTCHTPNSSTVDLSLRVFTLDDDNDGYFDNSRGTLSVHTTDGSWLQTSGRRCMYEVMQSNRVYKGMVAFVEVHVDNPASILHKDDPLNVWTISFSGKGAATTNSISYDVAPQEFMTLQQEQAQVDDLWCGNVAVISKLTDKILQPTDFRRSTYSSITIQFVRIWLRPLQYVGRKGYVVLDAPDGFDFGPACVAQDLPFEYYIYRGQQNEVVRKLSNMSNCTGIRYPLNSPTYNRAQIKVEDTVNSGLIYGFQIQVQHPVNFAPIQTDQWYLWTMDHMKYGLDGSVDTVRFNRRQDQFGNASTEKFYHRSYGMLNGDVPSSFTIEVQDLRPTSLTGKNAKVYIWPLKFSVFTDTSLRITAPYGYKWSNQGFLTHVNVSTRGWPTNPTIENDNQILFPTLQFANDQTYGFTAEVVLPDFAPTTSSNNYFVEFGYQRPVIQDRYFAAVLPTQHIRTLSDCTVDYGSNVKLYDSNFLEFTLQVVTPIPVNDGIIITGDIGTRDFVITCPMRVLPGSAQFPTDVKCISIIGTNGLAEITLKAQTVSIQPGRYHFEFINVRNPGWTLIQNFVPVPGKWRFGSYVNVQQYPVFNLPIDNSMESPGFIINEAMVDARLVYLSPQQLVATNRNDRPQKQNTIIMSFQLRNTPSSGTQNIREHHMMVRGPRGFVFAEDCLPSIITDKNLVFGPGTGNDWPLSYTVWPQSMKPTACTGTGRVANVTVPVGLIERNIYILRIGVKHNPSSTPTWNKWTIDYNHESASPFEGFTVWTFTNTGLVSVSHARSHAVSPTEVPVEISFRPLNDIPFRCSACAAGGTIRVTAPPTYEFVKIPGGVLCTALLYQTSLGIQDGSFPAHHLACWVPDHDTLELEIRGGTRSVQGKIDYKLVVDVYNPRFAESAQTWQVDSFGTRNSWSTPLSSVALDEVAITGTAIGEVLGIFSCTNRYNTLNGLATVNVVDVNYAFDFGLQDLDEIILIPPPGFNILGNPNIFECSQFIWIATLPPLQTSGIPKCHCVNTVINAVNTLQCGLRHKILEHMNPALPANTQLHFAIATVNPSRTPDVMRNFWQMQRTRPPALSSSNQALNDANWLPTWIAGQYTVLSSHVDQSWPVLPQLQNVQIGLHSGAYAAAGAYSSLELSFKAVRDASTLEISAVLPSGFSFGSATVRAPLVKDDRSEANNILINNLNIRATIVSTLSIYNVLLGSGGGQTSFNLITYKDSILADRRDEKIGFTGGFRLPGSITVVSQELQSKYTAAPTTYPVESLFSPQINVLAKAEFVLRFSQAASAAQRLLITSLGTCGSSTVTTTSITSGSSTACSASNAYELRIAPFSLVGKEKVDTTVVKPANTIAVLDVTLKPGQLATVTALAAGIDYTVTVWCIPQRGVTTWKFTTEDTGTLPTNTNDGITPGFTAVEKFAFTVSAPRRPPITIIDVLLNVNTYSAAVYELKVIAPPAFLFPSTGCGPMCTLHQPLGTTMRRTALIKSPTGGQLTNLNALTISVLTPELTPGAPNEWYVEARGFDGAIVGWGSTEGTGTAFLVKQMPANVSYAGVSNMHRAEMSFNFTLDVNAGDEISIQHPSNYKLICSRYASLRQGSLPGLLPTCTDEPMKLVLSAPLAAGSYSFAVEADVPTFTPSPNSFNLIIRDRDSNVVDASFELPGQPIRPIPMASPFFSWTGTPNPDATLSVTVGFSLTGPYDAAKAILISFPSGFSHNILRPSQVVNSNSDFPLDTAQKGGWAKYVTYTDKIKIELNPANTMIPVGAYTWNFPVRCPYTSLPKVNLWYVSVCTSRVGCDFPTDNAVVLSFPMHGFEFGELSKETLKLLTSAAQSYRSNLISTIIPASVLSVVFALLASCSPGV